MQQNSVTIISGANQQDIELVPSEPLTVGQVRLRLGDVMGIAKNATAVIGGINVADDRVLLDGETVEFIKDSGTKG